MPTSLSAGFSAGDHAKLYHMMLSKPSNVIAQCKRLRVPCLAYLDFMGDIKARHPLCYERILAEAKAQGFPLS